MCRLAPVALHSEIIPAKLCANHSPERAHACCGFMRECSPCRITHSVTSLSTVCEQQQQQQQLELLSPLLRAVKRSVCVSAAGAHAQKRMRKAVRGPDDALKETAGGAQVGGKGWEGGLHRVHTLFSR